MRELCSARREAPRGVTRLMAAAVLVGACGGDPPVGPDALRPDAFELVGVGTRPLPVPVDGLWLAAAYLRSVEPGRSVDPRIFENRSGTAPSGGDTRDSTTVSARMADIRILEERDGSRVVSVRRDSTVVVVERRGALLIVRREHPDPARHVVDTGRFDAGHLVLMAPLLEDIGFRPERGLFTYRVTTVGS